VIIVSLFEGLGNQMFQYATARCLAEKHSTVLKLDISSFESNKQRKYGLHCFNVQEHFATQNEINVLLKRSRNRVDRFFDSPFFNKIGIGNQLSTNLLQEKNFHFDPYILEAHNNTYLFGFWQSEKYFVEIRDILLSEFSIKYPLNSQNKELYKKIMFHESISLHIRRGDYVQDESTHQYHGVCSLGYYNRCIEYISDKVINPHFFVFSDDPEWVKTNLKQNLPVTIIENNSGFRSHEDLRLMSQCKHNIIANSSFSWWGAWLNLNPDKIVCTPQQWFRNKSQGTKYFLPKDFIPWYKDNFIDTKDLVPENWVQL
jgi:Glycosyl transferase family 11